MPIVAPTPTIDPLELATGNLPNPVAEESPGFMATLGAAFRTENTVGSALYQPGDPGIIEPGYNPWDDIKGTPYEQHWDSFAPITNRKQTLAIKGQIDRETQDRQIISAAGLPGTLASIGASVVDPTLLFPVGGEVVKLKEGYSIGKSALRLGVAGGLGTALQEGALQETQQLRTGEESALAIGGGIVLGGILGAGGAALLTRGEKVAALKAYDELLPDQGRVFSEGSAGAAARQESTIEDLTVAGRGANKLAELTQAISPNMRLNQSPSKTAREIGQDIAEGTMYQGMHEEGRTLGPAVETLSRVNFRARMADGVEAAADIFKAMKKSGINMKFNDFENAVGKAMRFEDVGENDFVSQAAKSWRTKVIEPYFNEAKASGLMEEGDKVAFAASYFPRQYNTKVLVANEHAIKDEWSAYLEGKVKADYTDQAATFRDRIANIEQEVADLKLSPEDRQSLLDTLDKHSSALDQGNADQIDRVTQINTLRTAAKAAKDKGDVAGAKGAQDEITRIQTEGGKALADYLAQRGKVRARQRRVDLNYAGLESRSQRVLNTIATVQDANRRALSRLVTKGQAFQRTADKLNPAKLDAQLSSLKTSFAEVLRRSEKAVERTAKASGKIHGETRARIEAALEKEGLDRWLLENANTADPAFAALNLKAAEKAAKRAKGRELTDIEKTRAETIARAELERDAALSERLSRDASAEAVRHDRLTSLAERIDKAEHLNPEAKLSEVWDVVQDTISELSDDALDRGQKVQRLRDRLKALDPKRLDERIATITGKRADIERAFLDRWEIGRMGQGVDPAYTNAEPSFRDLSRQIVDEVYDKLTGRNYGDSSSVAPEYMTPVERGPVKERTLPIPDEMLQRQGVLNDNVTEVLHRYARVMGADTELTKRFGSPTMADQFQKVRDEYRGLREDAKETPAELARLTKREAADVRDLQALRDLVRGTYKAAENANGFGRLVRAASHLNYIRSMGGAVVSSLTDLYRPAMVHGLKAFIGEGVAPLLTNMAAVKLSVKEAKLAGQITEHVLQQRMVSLGEIADPMARGSPVERFLENSTKFASKWNGLQLWTDGVKSITAIISQNRILDGKASPRLLAFLGIDGDMAERIGRQFADHGEVLDGVHVANTEKWTDELAMQHFRAAVSKDVDSIIVTPGVGDVPVFSHTPLGRLILQFRSFMFASHQRVLMRGLQEDKTRFLSSMVAMTTLGMLASTLKAWRGGQDRFDRFKKAAENPGYLIGEGLDQSGMFTLPFDVANTAEKLTPSAGFKFNPIKTPLMAGGALARPGASQQGESIRFASRGPLGTILGPSAGMVEQAFTAAGGGTALVTGGSPSKAQKNAAIGLIPFNSYLGMREAAQVIAGDTPYADSGN